MKLKNSRLHQPKTILFSKFNTFLENSINISQEIWSKIILNLRINSKKQPTKEEMAVIYSNILEK